MIVKIVLKQTLQERGILQKELAEKAGVRQAAISNLCRGYVDRVDLSHISRIASALGIRDINEIITLVEE